eukprot:55383-Eustigmatos_ZCMA.PRE.1
MHAAATARATTTCHEGSSHVPKYTFGARTGAADGATFSGEMCIDSTCVDGRATMLARAVQAEWRGWG